MLWVFCCFISPITAQSQQHASDSLMNEILALDSLLLSELEEGNSELSWLLRDIKDGNYLKSQFIVRAGYTSDITYAGRNFGVNQYGLNAGVAYYHKSGIFADVSGFFNSNSQPKYNTTITTAGYLGSFSPKWNYFVSYDHYFYHQNSNSDDLIDYPLTNALNASTTYYIKWFNFGVDYSFLFGDETAHRVRANVGAIFAKYNMGFIDRLAFSPNISMLMGNANVTSTVFDITTAQVRARKLMDKIGRRRFWELYNNDRELLETLLSETVTSNQFGVMNYSIFLPISFTIKKFTLLLTGSINFPVPLPGETDIDTTPNTYFSSSVLFAF